MKERCLKKYRKSEANNVDSQKDPGNEKNNRWPANVN